MSLPLKRPPSPLPRRFDDIRRIRRIDAGHKDNIKDAFTPLAAGGLPVRHGQEVLSLSSSLQNGLRHERINDLILETTSRLAREGKRLVRAPRLLSDGIAFDWTSDATARNEDMRSLLSVAGIRSGDLERVLLRATPVPGGPSGATPEDLQDLRDLSVSSPTPKISLQPPTGTPHTMDAGNSANPIVIEDDDDDVQVSSDTSKKTSMQDSEMVLCSSSQPLQPTDACETSTVEIQSPLSSANVEIHLNEVHAQDAISDDSSSVLSLEFERSVFLSSSAYDSTKSASLNDDVTGFPNLDASSSHNHKDDPRSDMRVSPCARRAEYGEWKALAEDSSDAGMGNGRLSSRESSEDRAFPQQPSLHVLPGLPCLPRSYDTSSLTSQGSSASAPGPSRTDSLPSRTEHGRSTPSRGSPLPHRKPYQPKQALETSRVVTPDSSPPPRRLGRRRLITNVHSGDLSEDDSDVNTGHKVGKPQAPPPRSGEGSRNLHRDYSDGTRAPRFSNRAADKSRRPRSTFESSRSTGSSSEDEDANEHAATSAIASGHTVVIPKASYARGRRLLAPANHGQPLTTILMRGEAHFVDRKRRTRISTWSLPVEDDARHVEDACLMGDDTVIVGYNKGPCQVSSILVREDQRPHRIDLIYKAHSIVNENPSAGKSYPNRGIASLASVAPNSFLSGGHDKTVHHWKLGRSRGRSKDRQSLSVSSVRIPTDHAQAVQALAYCGWNETVYSAAADRIATTKLTALAATEPERVSGKVTQVHVHPQDPRLIALEIDHMDRQVHLYDIREGGFARRPWLEFGYRPLAPKTSRSGASTSRSSSSSSSISKPGSRYTRGSTSHSLFARGYGDGAVLVWDFRNGAQKKVLERFQFQRPAEVAHTVLAGSDVIAYGGHSLTFWSMLAPSA
ncbi:hypothetical protein C8Q80DRAFT_1156838 [Daedaleopsis nitida]|nr:hypothetical protein C8Q80DRAFT_1156838 [Daedaleopsis nitida]